MLNFSWNINYLKVKKESNGLQNLVIEIGFYPYGSNGSLSIFGENMVIRLSEPDNNNFIPYENLDENTVLNWIFSKIDKASIEQQLQNKFDENNSVLIVEKVLPWTE